MFVTAPSVLASHLHHGSLAKQRLLLPMAAARGSSHGAARTAQRLLMALLLLVCLAGDWFQFQQAVLKDAQLVRHLADSATHGAVAFCCWGVFLCELALVDRDFRRRHGLCLSRTYDEQQRSKPSTEEPAAPSREVYGKLFVRCALAALAAMLLDLDHFIAAGSFSIAGATHLKNRPFGHAVTFIAVLVAAVRRYAKHRSAWTRRLRVSFVVVSLLSHQLRDGFRRGLWFWPLGSTPPIPYALYLVMEQGLPLVMAHWVLRVKDSRRPGDDTGIDDGGGNGQGIPLKIGQNGRDDDEVTLLTAREDESDESDEDGEIAPTRVFRGELIV